MPPILLGIAHECRVLAPTFASAPALFPPTLAPALGDATALQAAGYLMEATMGFSFLFCLALILIGMFLLALVLAVVGDRYIAAMKEEKAEAAAELRQAALGWGASSGKDAWVARAWSRLGGGIAAAWRAPLPGPLARSQEWVWRRTLQVTGGCCAGRKGEQPRSRLSMAS